MNQKIINYIDELLEEGNRVLDTKEYYNHNQGGGVFFVSLLASGYTVNDELYTQWVYNINTLISSVNVLSNYTKDVDNIKELRVDKYTQSQKYMSLIKSIKKVLSLDLLDNQKNDDFELNSSVPTINNIYNNYGGNQQNQLNTKNSTQNQTLYHIDKLNEFIQKYKEDKSKLDLSEGEEAYLDESITTLERELSQNSKNEGVIKKCLGSAKNVLEGCLGNVSANGLLQILNSMGF